MSAGTHRPCVVELRFSSDRPRYFLLALGFQVQKPGTLVCFRVGMRGTASVRAGENCGTSATRLRRAATRGTADTVWPRAGGTGGGAARSADVAEGPWSAAESS